MGIAGGLLGLLLSQGFIGGIRLFLLEQQQLVLESTGLTPYTGYLLLGTLCLSVFAALIPAVLAYRVNVTDVLSRGS
jgi:ABC-type antimicrobial peptide transport system permease subunit